MPAYLDCAATTPMRHESVEAMLPFLTERFANPSGSHALARDARRALDDAREELADLVGAHPGEVVFTAGGTEADNLAVFGVARGGGTAVCTAVEHHAVLDPVESIGGRVIGVDASGVVDLDALESALDDSVSLVSVMLANNEVGVVQPVEAVVELVRARVPAAVVHCDAVQGFSWIDPRPVLSGVDLVALSAHKFGGPKGVGLLVVRDGVRLEPLLLGGGQERDRRSGTQNVAGAVAMAAAARRTNDDRKEAVDRVGALRDRLADSLVARVPGVVETGLGGTGDRSGRIAGTCHVCIEGVESEALLYLLEKEEVYASAASSCASGALEPSHVLAAMGVGRSDAQGSLRLSLGHGTTSAEVDQALDVLPRAIAQLRGRG